ncbi:MAG: hypothetical protein VX527_10205 [Planctomycetota bacterium]|nr:hypothetical protein [Planctomycetota bacterium]
MALPAPAAEHFLTLADFGTPSQPQPDGYADRLLWDDARFCLVIHYLNADGLDRDDRSDQVVHIEVIDGGSGYGRAVAGTNGLSVRTIKGSDLLEDYRDELLADMPGLDPASELELDMWTIPLIVDEIGTEGAGLIASAILDGRAGAWSYYPVNHAWENPLLTGDRLPINLEDNDLQIVHGGSGYLLPPALLGFDQTRLTVRLTGESLGSLGFVPGGDHTATRFIPGDDTPVTETIDRIEITGDVLNPLFPRPGNWRNFLAHTPATGNALMGWSLPWAAKAPGQIADLLIVADGVGREPELVERESEVENASDDLLDDTAETDLEDSDLLGIDDEEDASTAGQYSELTDPDDFSEGIEEGDLDENPEDEVDLEQPLDVLGNEAEENNSESNLLGESDRLSQAEDESAIDNEQDAEPTSGVGYEPGIFEIHDGEGTLVRGWVIRYETDADGRIYVNAKGSSKPLPGNLTRERVGVPQASVYRHGWVIERNPSAILDTSGWTLRPRGGGTGFHCEGIQLFGELIALPPISNRTDSPEGYDVQSVPEIVIEQSPDAVDGLLAETPPEFKLREPALGRIVGSVIDSSGSSYYRNPEVTPLGEATGTEAQLAASLGEDGRRSITAGDQTAIVDLAGWQAHANGDFNGDGITDLLLHNPDTGESALWNLGAGGSVRIRNDQPEAHALPALLPAWKIGGIGRFGLEQIGCCVLWRNALTGQNAIWIIDSSHADPSKWIQPGSRFLPSVVDLGWSMACTNNAACNVGDRLYWIDPTEGSIAQWKIEVDPTRPTDEWLDQPDYLRDPDGERITGMNSSWELVGAGSLAGQPRSDGTNAFRDLLFFDRDSGRSAIWLMDGSGTQIDRAAPNGGAGFVTRSGAVIAGDIRHCRPVGIGQYALDDINWSRSSEDPNRTQWFPTIGWSLPGTGPWFTWRLDRQVDPVRSSQGSLEGTGKSANPFQVDVLR